MSSSPHFSPSAGEGPHIRRPTTAVLIVLSGARAGTRRVLNADFATLGRHQSSDLQFDPEQDSAVSARHAAVFRQGPGFVIRDLGSGGGTWVNGQRVRSDRSLEHGDVITLGAQGPDVSFTVEQVEERPPARRIEANDPGAQVPAATVPRRSTVIEQEQSTSALKLRVEAARQTDRLRRRLFGAAVLVALAVGAGLAWMGWSARQSSLALERERAGLLAILDSMQTVMEVAAGRAQGLRPALDSARAAARALRASIAARATSRGVIAGLDSEIRREVARHDALLAAARFDPADIMKASGRGLARIFVARGTARVSATGFVLRASGDTGWIATTRSVLEDSTDLPPERIAVAFNGGRAAWRARVVEVHRTEDLSLLQVVAPGYVFPVQEILLAATAAAGEPVVLAGYPGADGGGNWQRDGLRAVVSTATLASPGKDRLELEGYAQALASGSPVFNTSGEVIGVLSDNTPEAGRFYAIAVAALGSWVK